MKQKKGKSRIRSNFLITFIFFSFIFSLVLVPMASAITWETYGNKPNPYSHSQVGGYNGNFNESYEIIETSFGSEDIEPIAFSVNGNNLIAVQDNNYLYILSQNDLSVFQEINTGSLTYSGRGSISFDIFGNNSYMSSIWNDKFKIYYYNKSENQFNLENTINISEIDSNYSSYTSPRCSSKKCYFTITNSTSLGLVEITGLNNWNFKEVKNESISLGYPLPYVNYNNNDYFSFHNGKEVYLYNFDTDNLDLIATHSEGGTSHYQDIKFFYPLDNGEPRIITARSGYDSPNSHTEDSYIESYTFSGNTEITERVLDYYDNSNMNCKIAITDYNADADDNVGEDIFVVCKSNEFDDEDLRTQNIIEGNSGDQLYSYSDDITTGNQNIGFLTIADITGNGYGKLFNTPYFDFITTRKSSSNYWLRINDPKTNYNKSISLDKGVYECIPFLNQNTLKIDLACSGDSGTTILRSNYSEVKPFVYDPIEDQYLDLNSTKKIYIGNHFQEQNHFYIIVNIGGESYSFATGDLISNFGLDVYEDIINVSINRSVDDEWTEGDYILIESYDFRSRFNITVTAENQEGITNENFNVESGDYYNVQNIETINDINIGVIDSVELELSDYFKYANDDEYILEFEDDAYYNCSGNYDYCDNNNSEYRLKAGSTANLIYSYEDENETIQQETVYTIELTNNGKIKLNSNMETPFSMNINQTVTDPHFTYFNIIASNELNSRNQEFNTKISSEYESGELPFRKAIIQDFEMPYNYTTIVDLDDHYSNFNLYDVYVNGEKVSDSVYLYENETRASFVGKASGNKIKFRSFEKDYNFDVEVILKNTYGSISDSFNVDIFKNAQDLYDSPEGTEQEKDLSDSTFGRIVDQFLGFFPDSDELSTTQKLGFVFISLFLITAILMLIAYVESGRVDSLMLYLTAFIDAILLIFFIGIGYVPIGFVIILSLILIAIGYFKFFKGSGNGGGE